MNKDEIEKRLKEKYNDEYTIKMFTNFVLEFHECFSDIMSTEELINRIKKNIFGNIIIKDEFDNKNLDGKYGEDGYIYLKKSSVENEKYAKYLLFHEMLHAVTSIRDDSGKEIMMGFSYRKNCYGKGLNEAMTEYLTQIRNQKFEIDSSDLISGYRTIVEQIRRLILIIGDENLKKCYFHNPDSLKELLDKNKINYDELELAFRNLCEKDDDINAIGNSRKLYDNENYKLHRFSEMIFNNYANAIGEVNSLEDFKRKYEIFQTYLDGPYDCIITMTVEYYNNIGKDVDILLSKGISFDEIKPILQILKIDLTALVNIYAFSKCFVSDKNKSAIAIYEYYQKKPNIYAALFAENYGMIFDHFSEYERTPSDDVLYNPFIYPLIGKLLKEHPEIDYSDVSYDYLQEKNSKINVVIFSSSNGKKYAYTITGESIAQYNDEEGNQIFHFNVNEKCTFDLKYQKDGNINYSFNSTRDFNLEDLIEQLDFNFKHFYSQKEDLQYWIKEGFDEDGNLSKKLKTILKRIQDRGGMDFFDV